jgi:hypothetical protein
MADAARVPSTVAAAYKRAAAFSTGALVVGLWMVAALGVSAITGRITDWYVMTDELVYERLAISAARTGSPVPRIHETFIRSLDQLYPLLISPLFRHGSVPGDLHNAHLLGAWLMTSALIPAFLLARRVTERLWMAYLCAGLCLCVPWLIYSSFLLTETVAYPAFLWAIFFAHRCLASPSVKNDLFALGSALVAFFARTELVVLFAVLPVAITFQQLSVHPPRRLRQLRSAIGAIGREHSLLTGAYLVAVVAAAAFVVQGGRLLGLSVYGQEIGGGILPSGLGTAILAHTADLAFGMAILPFLVGSAWLLSTALRPRNPARHAFGCLGSAAVALVVLEAARYDLPIGRLVYDRYLFYVVPILTIAFCCAVSDTRRLRWSLVVPTALVCAGFALELQASFTWSFPPGAVNPDSPIAIFYHPIVALVGSTGAAQVTLVGITLVAAALTLVATPLLPQRRIARIAALALVTGVLASETCLVFVRLLDRDGFSGRPLTATTAPLAWVDQAVGPGASVTEIPYQVSSDYYVSLQYWRDTEFWNKSVTQDAEYPATSEYADTGIWFPKLTLAPDLDTGLVATSPSPYVLQSVTESRFQIAGNVQVQANHAMLIDAAMPWRLSWMSFGLYDDGWMRPHRAATIRVFPSPNQAGARIHYLSVQIWAPQGVSGRAFAIRTNLTRHRGDAADTATTFVNALPICVPVRGHSDALITAAGSSSIPPDLSSPPNGQPARQGSIYLADTSISHVVGPRCSLHAPTSRKS